MIQRIIEYPISIIGYIGLIFGIFLLILNTINYKRRYRIIDAVSDYHSMLIREGTYSTRKLRKDYMRDYNKTILISWINPKFIMKSELDWKKIEPFYYK